MTDLSNTLKRWAREGSLSEKALENLREWLESPIFDAYRGEITSLIEESNLVELEDAFRTRIEFGTGGMRGEMGAGPNRMNLRTIGEAAQGLTQYVVDTVSESEDRSIVIAHDTRHNSPEFARETARIVAANGVRAYLFDGFRSTPELSFAVRELGASAGIMITASHNPPTDNGFKAYWSDGGQIVPPQDRNIIDRVISVREITRMDFDDAVKGGRVRILDGEVDESYQDRLTSIALSTERGVRVVYTPLHGVGGTSVVPVLKRMAFEDLHAIEEQSVPDGDFPTLGGGVANPEIPDVFSLAIHKAREIDADLVLASDPDADRLGCALPDPSRGWEAPPSTLCLNGNQIGALLCHYILKKRSERGDALDKGVVAKTIVTTDLTGRIARSHGTRLVDNLLVGFKYIGEVIAKLSGEETFLFGTEESHGYLTDSFVRDKDAAIAAVYLCECAAEQRSLNRTLRDFLDDIYREFGYFSEIQKSVTLEGASGTETIARIMESLRTSPPRKIGDVPVVSVTDRSSNTRRILSSGQLDPVEGASGNVIAFSFSEEGHTRVTARPSGTEPKIKFYVSATSVDQPHLQKDDLATTKDTVDTFARKLLDDVVELAQLRATAGKT